MSGWIVAALFWVIGMVPTAMAGRAEGAPLSHWRNRGLIAFWPAVVVYAVLKLIADELR